MNESTIERTISSHTNEESADQVLKILVAEDNQVNQFIINKMFAHLGYTVDIAANGKEAVEKASEKQYNFIFTDIYMPEMNGYEATMEILQRASSANVPAPVIVAMTASALKEDRDECLRMGMHDYITKPVDIPQLQSILKKWNRLQ